eukprot:Macronucleus_7456.p1 GENE.Macronucleus_7456~~Macronucleus_7456.p1  ORF type:complete len:135 (+),score=44.16 Macronucleus_7456:1-405(+)
MAVQPLNKTKIIKKKTNKIRRYQSDEFKRVKRSWRKQRGVDSCVRRRFRGKVREPKVGSKQDKKTRHMLRSGFRKLLIRNEKDIELLLMNNRTYAGEIAQGISAKTRKAIVQRAKELNARLTNAQGKLKKVSAE